jgi:hypothetical protein
MSASVVEIVPMRLTTAFLTLLAGCASKGATSSGTTPTDSAVDTGDTARPTDHRDTITVTDSDRGDFEPKETDPEDAGDAGTRRIAREQAQKHHIMRDGPSLPVLIRSLGPSVCT